MSFDVTLDARNASSKINVEPQIVLKIDGVSQIYGTEIIQKFIRIGDPGLVVGGGWKIGGLNAVDNQRDYIALDGSTTSIQQQLNQDRGAGSGISSIQLKLIDKGDEISQLISPGIVVPDILARKTRVFIGFKNTAWPEDYITIFRGIIDDVISNAGSITFNISHPDQKKRQTIFDKIQGKLNGDIDTAQTSINLLDTTNILYPIAGPDGTFDPTIKFYVKIKDEIVQYSGISGNTLTGCIRGQMGTPPEANNDGENVETFYRLTGNGLEIALKVMLSGFNGPFVQNVPCRSFQQISPNENIPNAIFFRALDVFEEYGLVVGDYCTSVGSLIPANNFTNAKITRVVKTNDGSYITLQGVSSETELISSALISFRSQYDTLGEGCQMYPDEVDIKEHLRIFRLFLSSFQMDYFLKDTVQVKDFLDNDVYLPMACFSIPRKGQASVGYHIGPIPSANIVTLNKDNIVNGSKLRLRRTTTRNFFNTIVYRFDVDPLDASKFNSGIITKSADSEGRIQVGQKTLQIDGIGIRSSLNGFALSENAAARRLNRYKFGAEYFEDVQVLYRVGYPIEIGDIVLLDATDMHITNTKTGSRDE